MRPLFLNETKKFVLFIKFYCLLSNLTIRNCYCMVNMVKIMYHTLIDTSQHTLTVTQAICVLMKCQLDSTFSLQPYVLI